MQINKLITKINYYVYNDTNRIEYLVVHYVGASGGAEDNCRYFASAYRGSSAHYFVGHEGEIWQCVEDGDIAWHCGDDSYKHKYCRNKNSIGIELCCRYKDGKWYFEDNTVAAAIELTKFLMDKYNIPVENVIRHYDVTGKICPAVYVHNNTKHTWEAFKAALKEEKKEEVKKPYYYRVRKSWKDAASQIGAFVELKNAQAAADKAGAEYFVFDEEGAVVYPQVTLKVGDKVKLAADAVYYDGSNIPSWVKESTLYLRELNGDYAVISVLKKGAITGAVNAKYLR